MSGMFDYSTGSTINNDPIPTSSEWRQQRRKSRIDTEQLRNPPNGVVGVGLSGGERSLTSAVEDDEVRYFFISLYYDCLGVYRRLLISVCVCVFI